MSLLSVLTSRVRGLFGAQRRDQELEDELRFHVEMQTEDNVRSGMDAAEARYAAMRRFGAAEPLKEIYRDRRSFRLLETAAQDIRYAVRTLRRSPGFTATAITVLALAIGANSAMFSLLNAALFRPLPFRSPEQLAMLWSEVPGQGIREGRSTYRDIGEWRKQSESFSAIGFFDPVSVTLTGRHEARHISLVRMSPGTFELLGIQPLLGRTFTAAEAEQRQRLALISHDLWQTYFGGSPQAIGASLELDGMPSRIIGVIPSGLRFPQAEGDVWEPHTLFPDWTAIAASTGPGSWFAVGRIREGVSFPHAQAEMNTIAQRLDENRSSTVPQRGISVVPLRTQLTGPEARVALPMLTGAVLFVLLIAATNIASLSLARSAARQQELTTRAALGASRGRLSIQLLAESLTLAVPAGMLGLAVAAACIRLTVPFQPEALAGTEGVRIDLPVILWTFTLCLVTAVLVGLVPVLNLPSGQDSGRRMTGGVAARTMRRVLVSAEFALAIVLLAGAGLLLRSLWSAGHVATGFRADRVLSMQLASPPGLPVSQRTSFYNRVLEEIGSLPGVASAGIIGNLFIGGNPERVVTTEGDTRNVSERMRVRVDEVSTDAFRTLGAPLLKGRSFSSADGPDVPPVAIINETMSRRLWPDRDALGRRFRVGAGPNIPWFTVVGVVADMRRQGLEKAPIPQVFEPLAQNPSRLANIVVRVASDEPLTTVPAVRAAIARVDSRAPLYGVATLESQLDAYLAQRRFQTLLLAAFAAVALSMAAIGIYGTIGYFVATRRQEIGIRMAVGAPSGEIFRLVLGEGMKLMLAGLAVGVVGALGVSQLGSSLLFGVSPNDPLTFAAMSFVLITVGAAACFFPARRAMRIDPVLALRQD